MKATLWRVRVTMMGFVQEDMGWNELCDRSKFLTQMTIGDIDELCRVLPALRVSAVLTFLCILVSLIMTISLWLGSSSSSKKKEKKAKMRRRCINVRFIFDLLSFIF